MQSVYLHRSTGHVLYEYKIGYLTLADCLNAVHKPTRIKVKLSDWGKISCGGKLLVY